MFAQNAVILSEHTKLTNKKKLCSSSADSLNDLTNADCSPTRTSPNRGMVADLPLNGPSSAVERWQQLAGVL